MVVWWLWTVGGILPDWHVTWYTSATTAWFRRQCMTAAAPSSRGWTSVFRACTGVRTTRAVPVPHARDYPPPASHLPPVPAGTACLPALLLILFCTQRHVLCPAVVLRGRTLWFSSFACPLRGSPTYPTYNLPPLPAFTFTYHTFVSAHHTDALYPHMHTTCLRYYIYAALPLHSLPRTPTTPYSPVG